MPVEMTQFYYGCRAKVKKDGGLETGNNAVTANYSFRFAFTCTVLVDLNENV